MKLTLDINEVQNDENVIYLMGKLKTSATSAEIERTANGLVKRIVQCANSHIWGLLILLAQEEENSTELTREDES